MGSLNEGLMLEDIIVAHGEVLFDGESDSRELTLDEARTLKVQLDTTSILADSLSQNPIQQKRNLYEAIRQFGLDPVLADYSFLVIQPQGEDSFKYWLTMDGESRLFESATLKDSRASYLKGIAQEIVGAGFKFHRDFIIDLTDFFKPGGKQGSIDDGSATNHAKKCIELINEGSHNSIHCAKLVKPVSELLKYANPENIQGRLTKARYKLIELAQSVNQLKSIERDMGLEMTHGSVAEYLTLNVPNKVFFQANVAKTRNNIASMLSFSLDGIDIDDEGITDIKVDLTSYRAVQTALMVNNQDRINTLQHAN